MKKQAKPTVKKPWTGPRLVVYGDVREITGKDNGPEDGAGQLRPPPESS